MFNVQSRTFLIVRVIYFYHFHIVKNIISIKYCDTIEKSSKKLVKVVVTKASLTIKYNNSHFLYGNG